MALLSPGLALFLYGVSSIPDAGAIAADKVLVPAIADLVLMVGFVVHALRKEHPLIDLHLFTNRNLTIAVLTTTQFMIPFMGSMLLFPSYFLQVRGETTLNAGLLLAPQGLGAMPLVGRPTDKIRPGQLVLGGMV